MGQLLGQFYQGMFGRQFDYKEQTLFNFHEGQMRGDDLVHNGGWYNRFGEKIGWGDLSHVDFHTIQAGIEPGECFIILSEGDSFWNFVRQIGLIGSMCTTAPTANAPGMEYVKAHAMYVITSDGFYIVEDHPSKRTSFISKPWRGRGRTDVDETVNVEFSFVNRDDFDLVFQVSFAPPSLMEFLQSVLGKRWEESVNK